MNRRTLLSAGVILPAAYLPEFSFASAATYPISNPTMLVGFSAGGAGDIASRVVANYVKIAHSMALTPDFRPGAGGTIAADQARRASVDGSVISLYSVSPFLVAPHLQRLPYDTFKDFTYIGSYAGISVPCFVRSNSPHTTWDAILDYGRKHPRKLRWATAAPRGLAHIVTDAAFRQENVTSTFVPFRGGAEAVTALLGGHIDMVVSSDFGPHLASGAVRLLAETSPNSKASSNEIVSFADRNYPIALPASYGLIGPADMPKEIVSWWETTLQEMTKSVMYRDFLKVIDGYPHFQNSIEFKEDARKAYDVIGEQVKLMGGRL